MVSTITLQRSGLCPVRFTGELIVRSPDRISADLATAGRYVTISVYRTQRGAMVVHLRYATDHHGEQDNHLVALTQDVPRYLETIDPGEWCARAPPAARAALRSQYQAAIASLLPNLERILTR